MASDTYGAILLTTANDVGAMLQKKMATPSETYAPAVWAETINLLGKLPEATVSGSIVTFEDGADEVQTKSLVVTIPPTLSGVSAVTETQTGRNLAHFENTKGIDTNGNIYVDSKRCATVDFIPIKSGVSYKAYAENNRTFIIAVFNGDTLVRRTAGIRSGSTLDVSGGDKFRLCIYGASDVVCTVEDDKPRCYLSTETDTTYEPYTAPTQYTASLGRTIYGGQADVVNGTGEETHGTVTLDNINWTTTSNRARTSALSALVDKPSIASQITNSITSAGYTEVPSNATLTTGQFCFNTSGDLIFYYDGENLPTGTLVYPLATPTDFTFTGQEINTRLGYNAFWSEQGDTEVIYRRDIDLALQALSGSRGLMMARPPAQPETEETEPEDETTETIEETPEDMEK